MSRFALAPIPERKFGVAARSYVLFDNRQTGLVVRGTILERQFETYSGFLLWITHQPPLDGTLEIYLLSPAITVLDVRVVEGTIGFASLTKLFKTGDDVFQFSFAGADRWRLAVRKTPRRQIVRCASEWWQSATNNFSPHHAAFFADRYLELTRISNDVRTSVSVRA